MAEQKTKPTGAGVDAFLDGVGDPARREDCKTLVKIMKRVTKSPPAMWGASMVGFGNYHYKYPSGHEGDCFVSGFAPRKSDLTIYVMSGFAGHEALMKKLGKHKTGKSCLYVKRLEDIDLGVLEELIRRSTKEMKTLYEQRPG